MTAAKPGQNLPRRPSTGRRFITANTEIMLRDLFPGMIPSAVVEEAVRDRAIREGRLKKPARRQS
ncbi:hypothetical protein [Streptomyces sp. NPDC056723]|uniref:hypothetical protein n=1 Tax=Streptomyces sp. NPDC056723 TaxID=3345925 RepID=UPI0036881669